MIGIIGAMQDEVDILVDNLGGYEKVEVGSFSFYLGEIEGKEVVVSLCGIGKVNAAIATTILINHFECDFIINTGIAGGVGDVNCRDIIVADGLMYSDFDLRAFGYEFGAVPHMPQIFRPHPADIVKLKSTLNRLNLKYKSGFIASGDKFVTSLDSISEVKDKIVACEMEGAAIAHTSIRLGTRFLIIRYISDVVGKESQIENYHEFEEEIAKMSSTITLDIVRNL